MAENRLTMEEGEKAAEKPSKAKRGQFVEYTSHMNVSHMAIVTKLHTHEGRINVVAFANERGDEAATLYFDVDHSARPASNTWRPLR